MDTAVDSLMDKSKSFYSTLIPGVTVFFSSGCIMTLELVAGRLIAHHLGSSLYTWTSVIGVVLAGITIGNYLGGHIADRIAARKTLAVLFWICSVACVLVIVLNNLLAKWVWLWYFSWPLHVLAHASLLFLLPSTLLGMISPVAAKMALDQGFQTGRTVGDIYAWSAAGSIAGLLLAGFYLIAVIGTIAIVWIIAAALLLMAILFWAGLKVLYFWAAIFIALIITVIIPTKLAANISETLALKESHNPDILYEDETQYCYVSIKRIFKRPDIRVFMQDKLIHSMMVTEDINNLQYPYTRIYADITHALSENRKTLSVMIIGGGGYVYPGYVEKNWPGSHTDVVEIDPGVTKAAIQAFGLKSDAKINTITMDARNYVNGLLQKQYSGEKIPQYDFIYEDAINDYSVPYQLLTKEFNDRIFQILTDNGVYMLAVIDIFDSGRFLGAVFNTLQQTFRNVYILSQTLPPNTRNTFVVVATKQQIDIESIIKQHCRNIDIWYLDNTEINMLRKKSRNIVLTDDYAPVENMLAPVVRRSAPDILTERFGVRTRKIKR